MSRLSNPDSDRRVFPVNEKHGGASQQNDEFFWVISEDIESVPYDRRYKSFLKKMYEKRNSQ